MLDKEIERRAKNATIIMFTGVALVIAGGLIMILLTTLGLILIGIGASVVLLQTMFMFGWLLRDS